MADLHKTTSFDEDLKADYAHHEVAPQGIPTPAILENLSEEERAVIAKSTTRKVSAAGLPRLSRARSPADRPPRSSRQVDILIMPVMVTLYILNYLGEWRFATAPRSAC